MGKKEKFTFVSIFLMSFISGLTISYTTMLAALIVSKIAGEQFLLFGFINLNFLDTIPFIFLVCGIQVILWVFGMIHYYTIDKFGRKMKCIINERAQEVILLERKNLDFGMTIGEADYIIKSAVDHIPKLIEPFCWKFVANIITGILIFVQMFTISWTAGLVAMGITALVLICAFSRTKIQKKVFENIEIQDAKISNHFLMSLTNLPMITMLKSKFREMAELKKLNDLYYKENVKAAKICYWYWIIVVAIEYIGFAVVIATYILTTQASTSFISSITSLFSSTNQLYGIVEDWGWQLNGIQTAAIKLCNLQKIFPQQDMIQKQGTLVDENILNSPITKLQVSNYQVKLGRFEKEYNQTFESGKIYSITGESGQGKTTLINAICGLREISDGYITINDTFLIKNMSAYRDKISYLFQDSILFDRSIAENIAYPDQELNKKANSLVRSLKIKKLLNREQNNGAIADTLSGGEKKRIDIIRTISKDRDIYLFDEPTNELDPVNVDKVLEEIQKLAKENKIVIIISHDTRCISIADEIVSL